MKKKFEDMKIGGKLVAAFAIIIFLYIVTIITVIALSLIHIYLSYVCIRNEYLVYCAQQREAGESYAGTK